ncbi:hypothetical protein ABZ897_57785 [Nonomuraea sp. NPDC046802]|uniref:hypothetical protein n=1 Tax=Nonomuraea sp. NPDC046802 TaxID=3154919 RepID=UPI0033C07F8A
MQEGPMTDQSNDGLALVPSSDAEQLLERSPFKPPVRRFYNNHKRALANLVPLVLLGGAHGAGWLFHTTQLWVVWAFCWAVPLVMIPVILVMRTEGRVWWGSAAAVLAWLLTAAAVGLSDVQVFMLWTAGLLRSVPYWRAHQRRYSPQPSPEPEPEPEADEDDGLAPEQRIWEQDVAPNNTAYASTRLDIPEPLPGGFTALIIGKKGKTEFEKMLAGKRTISSAYGTTVRLVGVEEVTPPNDSRARLTIISRDDMLAQTRFLEDDEAAIDPVTGIARVAYFFDSKPAHAQFYTPTGGMQMGLIFGRTESGKTRYAETKFLLAHQSDTLVTAVLDAQDGQSMPECLQAAQISAVGVEGVFQGLGKLLYVSSRRSQFLGKAQWIDERGRERTGKQFLLPGTELIDPRTGDVFRMPGIWSLFDELRLLLKDPEFGKEAVRMLGAGVATMRKTGIGVEGVAQNVGLDYLVEQGLRSNLAGNVAGFRTRSSDDHGMVGLPADPSKLEEVFASTGETTAGLCYLNGPDGRPRAKARGLLARDVYGLALEPPAGELDDLTKGFLDDYDRMIKRGGNGAEALAQAEPCQPPPSPTQGDVEAAIESTLEDGPLPVDQLIARIGGRIANCTYGQIEGALRSLERAERISRRGDLCQRVGVHT